MIEQAKGMLIATARIRPDEAFALLRRHPRNYNLKLTEVSRVVIDGSIDLGPAARHGQITAPLRPRRTTGPQAQYGHDVTSQSARPGRTRVAREA